MSLLNYTTSVPTARTIAHINALLVEAGARQIMTEYDEGRAVGIAFAIHTPHGQRNFVLPVKSDRVHAVLARDPKVKPGQRTPEHAERVGWRIVKDWLEAQLAIIETEMVTLDQVMLPYMATDDGRSMYELYVDQQPALTAGTY